MEDYTDVYDYGEEIHKSYPTYRDFNTEELRAYFSWRSQVRKGVFPFAPRAFICMYAYEIINGIGISSPEQGIERLKQIVSVFTPGEPDLARMIKRWTVDYCVYNELDPSLAADQPDLIYDNALIKLIDWESTPDDELFSAISALSGYQIERSQFYCSDQEIFSEAAVRVFRRLSEFFRSNRKNSLCETFFGHRTEMNCRLFEFAVFYDRQPARSTDYELDPIHTYTCRNGAWRCSRYYGSRSRSQQLGEILKMLDYLLRERTDYRYKLRPAKVTKVISDIINKELDAIDAEKNRRKAMEIEIDLSKIEGIRAAADVTRDKLIVEEEEVSPTPVAASEPEPAPVQENSTDSPLSDSERLFLQALLNGGDWASAARQTGEMPSLLADSINDKLFDLFGDTVIDCSADVPEVIEDYAEELKNYV